MTQFSLFSRKVHISRIVVQKQALGLSKVAFAFLAYVILVVLLIGLAYLPGYNAAWTGPSLYQGGYSSLYGYFGGEAVVVTTAAITATTTTASGTTSTQCREARVIFLLPQGGTITADGTTYTHDRSATYCIGQRVHIIAVAPSGYLWWRWDTGGLVSVDSHGSSDTFMTVRGPGGLQATFVRPA
jgi:hypothetical protein